MWRVRCLAEMWTSVYKQRSGGFSAGPGIHVSLLWRRPAHLTEVLARLLTVESWYLENSPFLLKQLSARACPAFAQHCTNVYNACIDWVGWGLGIGGAVVWLTVGHICSWYLQHALYCTIAPFDAVSSWTPLAVAPHGQQQCPYVHRTIPRNQSQRLWINQPWRKQRTANHQIT